MKSADWSPPADRHPIVGPGGRPFAVVPAVDLLGDQAVRLERGDFRKVRLRAGDPVELVSRFAAERPALIHVVDLEGARSGRIRPATVERLSEAAGDVPLQVSGGIRSIGDAERLLDAGATRLVVGTAAHSAPGALAEYAAALTDRLVVAIDVRAGTVAISGWERSAGLGVEEAVDRCVDSGVQRLLCTAIERDGTMAGPDVHLLARVSRRSGLPILAGGGIRSETDLRSLAELGLEGAVVGRALLEGRIPVSAIRT